MTKKITIYLILLSLVLCIPAYAQGTVDQSCNLVATMSDFLKFSSGHGPTAFVLGGMVIFALLSHFNQDPTNKSLGKYMIVFVIIGLVFFIIDKTLTAKTRNIEITFKIQSARKLKKKFDSEKINLATPPICLSIPLNDEVKFENHIDSNNPNVIKVNGKDIKVKDNKMEVEIDLYPIDEAIESYTNGTLKKQVPVIYKTK